MTFSFRPARRSEAKPLIGLYAESGCGKTYSALLLARGFVGQQGKIGMIETEAGRGEAYADILPGGYEVLSIRQNFSPENFGQALTAAEAAKLDALIIDSASHEWEGAGGVLAMAAENQAAGKKGPIVWQRPKMDHQRHFMLRLLATPISLVIVCMRAKYPMVEQRNAKGEKEWIRSPVLEPKQADDILFEMFVHGWIDREHRLHVTKYTRPDLAQVIRDNEPITIETGRALADWSRGAKGPPQPVPADQPAPPAHPTGATPAGAGTLKQPVAPGGAGQAPAPVTLDKPAGAGADLTSDDFEAWDIRLKHAASQGTAELKVAWDAIPRRAQDILFKALESRHKPAAVAADQQEKTS